MLCENCGDRLLENANFCVWCGVQTKALAAPPYSDQPANASYSAPNSRLCAESKGHPWHKLFRLALLIASMFLLNISIGNLLHDRQNYAAAQIEYADLRELISDNFDTAQAQPEEDDTTANEIAGDTQTIDISLFAEMNSDFVGWLSITGTPIQYPVVQGSDNVRYLNTTFRGERNPSGAIFMDYRAHGAFNAPIVMLYGHNMRDGSMFAALRNYLDPEFINSHYEITVIAGDGEFHTYEVVEVRRTDGWDPIYHINFNCSETAYERFGFERMLILSTCYNTRGNLDQRILLFARHINSRRPA